MSIVDAIKGIFAGDRPEPQTGPELITALKQQHGSVRAAGRATGIPESTLRRWGKGATPGPRSVDRVDRARRDVAAKRIDQSTFVLKVKDRHPDAQGKHRERNLKADQLKLAPGTLDKVRAAHVAGQHDKAAKEFLKGIQSSWYRGWLTPGSDLARSGTEDGLGGGPAAAVSRNLWSDSGGGSTGGGGGSAGGGGSDHSYDGGDYDYDDLAYEGWDDSDSDYGAQIIGGSGS